MPYHLLPSSVPLLQTVNVLRLFLSLICNCGIIVKQTSRSVSPPSGKVYVVLTKCLTTSLIENTERIPASITQSQHKDLEKRMDVKVLRN